MILDDRDCARIGVALRQSAARLRYDTALEAEAIQARMLEEAGELERLAARVENGRWISVSEF